MNGIRAALTIAVWFLLNHLITTTPATAACYSENSRNRLANFCAVNKLKGSEISVKNLEFINQQLNLEGFSTNLGFPKQVSVNTVNTSLNPIFFYTENLNGGNSPEPLVLGGLSLDGETELHRKEGFVAGLSAGLSGRYIHAEGRYLDYGISTSSAHNPKHGLDIASTNANFCSINHIKNWWYLDACAHTSRLRKDITDNVSSNISLISSKMYVSSKNTHSEASFGINRYFAETYSQNQVLLGFETIHSSGVYSSADVTLGEFIKNELSTRLALRARITNQIAQKPLTLSFSYAYADGSLLLGFKRSDETYEISASYPIWNRIKIGIGYKLTDSTINYFDIDTPTFSIQFPSLTF